MRMRGGKIVLAMVAFATAMMLALAGSYAGAQTMGEYGATVNSAGVATQGMGGPSSDLAGAPNIPSPLDRPSPLDSGNDPFAEAPNYFENSGGGSGGLMGGLGEPTQDSAGIQYAPTVN
jgi:hypothetical protein